MPDHPHARGRRTGDEPEPYAGAPEKKGSHLYVALAVLGLAPALILLYVFTSRPAHEPGLSTRNAVKQLEVASEIYNQDRGQYPWTRSSSVGAKTGIIPAQVYAELTGNGKVNKTEDYIANLSPRFVKNGQVVDSWGKPLQIRVDPKDLRPMIWSTGPNGKDETNDGSSTNPAKMPKTYYWFGKGDTGDDIWNK